jgi:hypothetical protein
LGVSAELVARDRDPHREEPEWDGALHGSLGAVAGVADAVGVWGLLLGGWVGGWETICWIA